MFSSPAQRTFKSNWFWRTAIAIPLLILLGLGIYDYYDRRVFEPVLWSLVAFFAVPFIFALVWAATRRIAIHEEGISSSSIIGRKDLRWDEITETRYGQRPVKSDNYLSGILWFVLSAITKGDTLIRSFLIMGPRTIRITSNISQAQEAIRMVLDTVNPRLRQDAERMLSAGGTAVFGHIALSPTGVVWKSKEPIPYAAIVKCRLDDAMLRIKGKGKWLDNIAIRPQSVPNVFVLLDMIEARRDSESGQQAAAAAAGSSARQYL